MSFLCKLFGHKEFYYEPSKLYPKHNTKIDWTKKLIHISTEKVPHGRVECKRCDKFLYLKPYADSPLKYVTIAIPDYYHCDQNQGMLNSVSASLICVKHKFVPTPYALTCPACRELIVDKL